jgi:CheY-like chemotaxis protein
VARASRLQGQRAERGCAEDLTTTGSPEGSGLRILLVEDEATNRILLQAVLTRSPDERVRSAFVVSAETLAEARSQLNADRWDAIVLDVRLPDGNGLDLVPEIADGGGHRPRIIVWSASVLPHERAAALETGCDAFLGKPFRSEELLELMAGIADRPRA